MPEPALDPNNDALAPQTRVGSRVDAIKQYLSSQINQHADITDSVAVALALMEMAIDKFIDLYGEKVADHLIATTYQAATKKAKTAQQQMLYLGTPVVEDEGDDGLTWHSDKATVPTKFSLM